MTLVLEEPRVLVCGSRRWPWPATVETVLERLLARHGEGLVVIEGAVTGADHAAHAWCERRGLGPERHRCHPVDWQAERRERPRQWRMAGPERNTRMLLEERPRLIVAFHDHFSPGKGGTSDMCLRGLIKQVPAWLVPGEDVQKGTWLHLGMFPRDGPAAGAARTGGGRGRGRYAVGGQGGRKIPPITGGGRCQTGWSAQAM